ncbi:glycerophosphodiester phosphodiesterase [uncultured Mobiluncus sp.]|uniref:glycerophosphodiester phosphodiesterase n=1 Tax=uncultured Mobiluncus sp. TaxID=293425 RepID=UPI0028056747|nr:glycerophosphodiester phosphodiesterase [uncultured Mobiluncus sp.]
MKHLASNPYASDRGDLLLGTQRALELAAAKDVGAAQFELFSALRTERLIVEAPVAVSGSCESPTFAGVYSPYGFALPVYSSATRFAELTNPEDRPLLVNPSRIALAALATEGFLWLDAPVVLGSATEAKPLARDPEWIHAYAPSILLGPPALNALASGDDWLPAWDDAELATLLSSLSAHTGTEIETIAAGPAGGLIVTVRTPGDRDAAKLAVKRFYKSLLRSPEIPPRATYVQLLPVR